MYDKRSGLVRLFFPSVLNSPLKLNLMTGIPFGPHTWLAIYSGEVITYLFRDISKRCNRQCSFAALNTSLTDCILTPYRFCELFQQPSTCRTALCSYAGFLQRISTTHESLQWLLPSSPTPSLPSIPRTTWLALITSLRTFLHPGTVFFLPVALVHMPAYALGLAASRFLAPRGEHESVVQFRVIVGGIGAAISYSTTLLKLASWLGTFASSSKQAWGEVVVRRILGKMENDWGQSGTVDLVERLGRVLSGGEGSTKRVLVAIGFAYIGTWALAKWHAALVTGFVKR